MTKCLIALGSNLGDRAATLDAAIGALSAVPGVAVIGQSAWQLTMPVGCMEEQPAFLNGAALIETSHDAFTLLSLLQQIESQHGRERHERWGDRTLDLDLLLYGDAVIDTPTLRVPHQRMSFRRFVLEPAVEIVGATVHPAIGWSLERLLDHLDAGSDCVAIVSAARSARDKMAAKLRERFGMTSCESSIVDEQLWPTAATTWLAPPNAEVSSGHPKLTILLDLAVANESGRGPTLRIAAASHENVEWEVFAAIKAVWPRLGSLSDKRLQ